MERYQAVLKSLEALKEKGFGSTLDHPGLTSELLPVAMHGMTG